MAVSYKQNDTTPPYVAVLKTTTDGVDTAVDLTLASSAKFLMRVAGGAVKVNATATISDAANGEVTYTWGATDLNTAGVYDAEIQVTWADSTVETFPNGGYNRIRVLDDIA